jgi:hypothetical protein
VHQLHCSMCHRDTLYRALELFNLTKGRPINETSTRFALVALGILPDADTVEFQSPSHSGGGPGLGRAPCTETSLTHVHHIHTKRLHSAKLQSSSSLDPNPTKLASYLWLIVRLALHVLIPHDDVADLVRE